MDRESGEFFCFLVLGRAKEVQRDTKASRLRYGPVTIAPLHEEHVLIGFSDFESIWFRSHQKEGLLSGHF